LGDRWFILVDIDIVKMINNISSVRGAVVDGLYDDIGKAEAVGATDTSHIWFDDGRTTYCRPSIICIGNDCCISFKDVVLFTLVLGS